MCSSDPTVFPKQFQQLIQLGCLSPKQIQHSSDGFYLTQESLEAILAPKGITELPDDRGESMVCSLFFDDWYPYAISCNTETVYSLLKLREQESDRSQGLKADGDTPGVTVCFTEFDMQRLISCLEHDCPDNRRELAAEINRVVSKRGCMHHSALKSYFVQPEAQAPYLIAQCYVGKIASYARNGILSVPEVHAVRKQKRIRQFLEEMNIRMARVICDNGSLFLSDPENLTREESLAILATHTANISYHSFAAEIRCHALFLTAWIRKIPVLGMRIYESAIRADLSIDNGLFAELAPYYRVSSRMVKLQSRLHPEYD